MWNFNKSKPLFEHFSTRGGQDSTAVVHDSLTCGHKRSSTLFSSVWLSFVCSLFFSLISVVIVLGFVGLRCESDKSFSLPRNSSRADATRPLQRADLIETSSLFSVKVMSHLCELGLNKVREREKKKLEEGWRKRGREWPREGQKARKEKSRSLFIWF